VNRALRRGGTAVIVLIVALLANITYIQVVKAGDYRKDPLNRRVLLEEVSRQRGQITAAGGVVLAKSDRSDDSYRYQRSYPLGAAYANLTGYYSLRYSPTAMEAAQDELLSGEASELTFDRVGDFLTGRDPRGGNVELTILPKVQKVAYDELTNRGLVGAVVAIRPTTGEILALASTPGYDPNPFASHSDSVQREAWNALHPSDPTVPTGLADRTIERVYPPGSTFKLLVAAAALSQGLTPQQSLTGAASLTLPGTNGVQLQNYGGNNCGNSGGGNVTMTVALANSCNTAFAELGMQLGAEALRRQAVAFGLDGTQPSLGLLSGGTTQGGLTAAASRLGAMADAAAVGQSSIGQRDVALTPLQTAVVTATIANKGSRMMPYLVARTTAPDLKEIAASVPTVANATALSQQAAADLTAMMRESERVTGGENQISGVAIASKTGTAEHGADPKNTPPYVSYAAFAPADNPQVAVVVFIEGGRDVGLNATGRTVAAPVGRLVIAAALQGG
jgi:penicillin-binding protein A